MDEFQCETDATTVCKTNHRAFFLSKLPFFYKDKQCKVSPGLFQIKPPMGLQRVGIELQTEKR
jgi:hypothetical protein